MLVNLKRMGNFALVLESGPREKYCKYLHSCTEDFSIRTTKLFMFQNYSFPSISWY